MVLNRDPIVEDLGGFIGFHGNAPSKIGIDLAILIEIFITILKDQCTLIERSPPLLVLLPNLINE